MKINSDLLVINVGEPAQFGISVLFGERDQALLLSNPNAFIQQYIKPCLAQLTEELKYRAEKEATA